MRRISRGEFHELYSLSLSPSPLCLTEWNYYSRITQKSEEESMDGNGMFVYRNSHIEFS